VRLADIAASGTAVRVEHGTFTGEHLKALGIAGGYLLRWNRTGSD
jgi:hypothetical protein